MIITGPQGVGKRELAEAFARSLLCRARDAEGYACGHCPDCLLLAAGSHPDLTRVGPEPGGKSREISVGTIRTFSEHESLTPSRADWKVALIDPADHLNPSAANALLKTLEEPSGQTLLCLIAEHSGQLPATIRSRCLQIKVPIPDESVALAWLSGRLPCPDMDPIIPLRLAHGAPLRALVEFDQDLFDQRRQRLEGFIDLALGRRDPVVEAAAWTAQGPAQMLDWLSGWVCDLLRLKAVPEAVKLINPDQREAFSQLAERIESAAGHRFLKRIMESRALADSNLNHSLMLEALAIDWFRLSQRIETRRY
ncbi:DNA polymerase III subunit delta' [Thiorhodococcus drewsii AZ1]|uniref:DNA polymerase III subunit delta' n=2 Tax=Thiorhodococcus drewsii TaxID=210408 RepID=G2DWK2_9GAMM|nr:DNA polymerase III subunit delta' [Thiorhodococcus drewsii AZ1]